MTGSTEEAARLRKFALAVLADPIRWEYGDQARDLLVPLSGYADDAWADWKSIVGAKDGQWFVFRDPDDPADMRADQVMASPKGRIEGKYCCGLDYYPECQPCRFADDVRQALIAASRLDPDASEN